MIRALLLLIALVILVVIGLAYTGFINLRQTQQAQAPKYELQVKEVGVGTSTANVTVPTVGTETKQIEYPTVTVSDGNQANAQ
jgi:Tfp pilus assembly protein PilV